MAAPVAGDPYVPHLQHTDDEHTTSAPYSAEDDPTISQLTKSTPPAPLIILSGKRRKSKPVRYGVSSNEAEKTNSQSKFKIVVRDPSSKCLSFEKEKSATKSVKSLVHTLPAMIRAGEVQASLGPEYPSCIKMMVKSHVSTGFSMGLPQPFCKLFLPKTDAELVVEDENGEKYHLRYIAHKAGLSAGWKKFVVEHNLHEGDVLVFQLVGPCKFKVYIIRSNNLNEVDGALGLLHLEACPEQTTPENNPETDLPSPKTNRTKRPKSLPLIMVQKKHKPSAPPPPPQTTTHPTDHSGNDSEEVGSEVLEGSRPSSKPPPSFQDLKSFQDFRIVVNGLCIDSELPDDVRMDYYTLCTSKKQFLHDALPDSLYHKLVAGMIGETVNIANEIKNCRITTTEVEFEVWCNTLKSFELLGMKVGFLRERIDVLRKLVFESEGRVDIERFVEAKKEKERVEGEILRLTESSRRLEGIMEGLKEKVERHEVKFQEQVGAPW